MIQFRMLNKSKGPAMWSPRAQSDRMLFAATWREMLENTPNVEFYQDMVNGLIIEKGIVKGVITGMGNRIYAKSSCSDEWDISERHYSYWRKTIWRRPDG